MQVRPSGKMARADVLGQQAQAWLDEELEACSLKVEVNYPLDLDDLLHAHIATLALCFRTRHRPCLEPQAVSLGLLLFARYASQRHCQLPCRQVSAA